MIVFRTNRDTDHEIYRVRPDGTDLTRLTESQGLDSHPTISYDGTRVAFTTSRYGAESQVVIANADGSNPTRPGLFIGRATFAASFMPDSAMGLVLSYRSYDFSEDISSWRGSPDGSESSRGLVNAQPNFPVTAPALSPNGGRLVYARAFAGQQAIYVLDALSPGGRRVTDNEAKNSFPAWSPDGTQIAYESDVDGRSQIYVVDPDGLNVRRVTDNASTDRHPTWSPDGTRIAFESDRGGEWDIWIIDLDDGNLTNLTSSPNSSEREPYWGPAAP